VRVRLFPLCASLVLRNWSALSGSLLVPLHAQNVLTYVMPRMQLWLPGRDVSARHVRRAHAVCSARHDLGTHCEKKIIEEENPATQPASGARGETLVFPREGGAKATVRPFICPQSTGPKAGVAWRRCHRLEQQRGDTCSLRLPDT